MQDIDKIEAEWSARIEVAADIQALEDIRVKALGKKGEVSLMMRSLGKMTPEERQVAGPALNGLKDRLNTAITARRDALEDAILNARLESERVDVTLPVARAPQGSVHPVSQVYDEITEIFADMGFALAEGPEIEDDFHNFNALNIPEHHPARAMHDTFYFPQTGEEAPKLLRTHTSPVQIRHMLKSEPPIRIIAPGRVYRCDSDATHTPMFHQVEALVIDKSTHMGHLKGVFIDVLKAFFEVDDIEIRFRPSYFPFTEPSAEVDVRCSFEKGGVKVGVGDDWLEIAGSGMVHRRVLEAGGHDPDVYQGFAFGMGLDRLAMLKYGAPDLRAFFDADLRWLRHYGFSAFDLPTLSGGVGA
ncbi:MAG: phenylalanine--tRNA ligase subunit alpha [Sphingomonadales bacterium]